MDGMLSGGQLIKDFTENYMEKIFYFCLKKTGNEYEAEDLTSDISLNIISALGSGTVPGNFPAWVWKIARNRYSAWAARKANRSASVTGADISDYEIEDDQATIEEKMIREENLSLLRRELAFISFDYRNILIAYYIEDRTTRSIAQSLNLPRGTVEARLFRARKILKEGMNMAREFGPKSYNPEKINFSATGNQPSGLPWSAVQRSLPRNILLEASDNPSTAEELSMALGISLPYMEEEIMLLKEATLLKEEGNKYITNFFILDKESQLEIYQEQRTSTRKWSSLLDILVSESLDKLRAVGIAHSEISDNTIKWWAVPYTIDLLIPQLEGSLHSWPKRENGEDWGFIGYEHIELPENCRMSHSGVGLTDNSAQYWLYKLPKYNLMKRREMHYDGIALLSEVFRNSRSADSFTPLEQKIWTHLEKHHFAHAEADGKIVADIIVMDKKQRKEVGSILRSHPLYEKILADIQASYDRTLDILSRNNSTLPKNQIAPYASLQFYEIRCMAMYDEIENGRLLLPEDPANSTVSMHLELYF